MLTNVVGAFVLLAGLGVAGAQPYSVCGSGAPCYCSTDGGCYTPSNSDRCPAGAQCPPGITPKAPAPTCNGVPIYDPSYVCPTYNGQGFLCPATAPCACPGDGGGCYTVANAKNCPGGAHCAGASGGDPLVQGFDGCSWYLQGRPGDVMCLISETNHAVNTALVAANLIDEHHNTEGTFHGAISMRFGSVIVVAQVDSQGNLTVSVDEQAVPFGSTREQSGLTVKVTEFYPYFGQVAEVLTPAFRFFIHAVQPADTAAGWSRGHLDFSTTVLADNIQMHGLLGQSIKGTGALCPGDFIFHGEGIEADYLMSDLAGTDFIYTSFGGAKATRRLHSLNMESAYPLATKPMSAYSEGLMQKSAK